MSSVQVAIFLGFASAIVDNVPLVAAAQVLNKHSRRVGRPVIARGSDVARDERYFPILNEELFGILKITG